MQRGGRKKSKFRCASREAARGHEPVAQLGRATAGNTGEAVHWSTIGAPSAPDDEIVAWAREQQFALITNDLDFSAILAATSGQSPTWCKSGLKTSCRRLR